MKVKREKKQRQLPSDSLLSPTVLTEPGKAKGDIKQNSIGDEEQLV